MIPALHEIFPCITFFDAGWSFHAEYFQKLGNLVQSSRDDHMACRHAHFTRMDASETFNADQLWFRNVSVLIQGCSLPENLWTTLIQSWTMLIFNGFRFTIFCYFLIFLKKNQMYLNIEAHNSDFQAN